jgi:hypothetical protein
VTTPSPELARRNRKLLLLFIALFVFSGIGITIFGFTVVERVKEKAALSDAALRARAWSILAMADTAGRFPIDGAEAVAHLAVASLTDRLAGGSVSPAKPSNGIGLDEDGFPDRRDQALTPLLAPLEPDSAQINDIVVVSWSPEGLLPPVLSVGGRPSGLVTGGTTLDLVNLWLRRASQRLGR